MMTDSKKCDRCGRFYMLSRESSRITEWCTFTTSTTKRGGDLCPKCAKSYAKWWDKKKGAKDGR